MKALPHCISTWISHEDYVLLAAELERTGLTPAAWARDSISRALRQQERFRHASPAEREILRKLCTIDARLRWVVLNYAADEDEREEAYLYVDHDTSVDLEECLETIEEQFHAPPE